MFLEPGFEPGTFPALCVVDALSSSATGPDNIFLSFVIIALSDTAFRPDNYFRAAQRYSFLKYFKNNLHNYFTEYLFLSKGSINMWSFEERSARYEVRVAGFLTPTSQLVTKTVHRLS